MNEYLTFQRVLELLESFQKESPILNSFGYGNLVDFSRTVSASTVNYPYMFVVPLSINYDENITEYQFSILFADLLNYDLSNEAGCVSDMSLQAKRFMSYIKRGINTFPELYDNLDIVLPTGAIPFMERFGDHTAGVALDCVIQVFEDLNACDFYPSPTPTAEPTNTPSMTPSSTPPVTPTMTMTPSITPSASPVPSCINPLFLTSNFGPSIGEGLYQFDGYGYLDIDGPTLTLFTGLAPDANPYVLYKQEPDFYVVKSFSGSTEFEWNWFNGDSVAFGAMDDSVVAGYNVPSTIPTLDWTVSYPNC